jgi:magnesium-transporting ATPase (P-type)
VPVETRQAGGSVSCECGVVLEIPRLLELKKLEKVATEAKHGSSTGSWGAGHSISLIGLVAIVLVVIFTVRIFSLGITNPYDRMTLEQLQSQFAKMTPEQTWQTWNLYKQIGVNPQKQRFDRVLESEYEQRQLLLVYLGIAGLVSLAVTVAGLVLVAQKRKRSPNGASS